MTPKTTDLPMSSKSGKQPKENLLGSMIQSIGQAAKFNQNAETAPVAVLWTDKDREWEALIPQLRSQLPHLLTFGPITPEFSQGPALWLKCALAGQIPGLNWPPSEVPILYLPGVSRSELRAIEGASPELQSLGELQYRSAFWSQKNGKDWTVRAFLTSPHGGLGLDMAEDQETLTACREVLVELAEMGLASLLGKRLEAADFHALVTPDLHRDVLLWLGNPEEFNAKWQGKRWKGFCGLCVEELKFSPQKDGHLTAAERMAARQGAWDLVWQRFVESPAKFQSITKRLEEALPKHPEIGILVDHSSNPNHNRNEEDHLRDALKELPKLTAAKARDRILQLEEAHGKRRDWVWVHLDRSPLALALEHLVILAKTSGTAVAGSDLEALAEAYATSAWRVDDAAMQSLAGLPPSEESLIKKAVKALYEEWLDEGAVKLQKMVISKGYPKPSNLSSEAEPGTVVLFADGLRFDVARRLEERLSDTGWTLELGRRWSAFPPVTATCKPAISPLPEVLTGSVTGKDFSPAEAGKDTPLSNSRFLKLLEGKGWQVLSIEELGEPSGKGWIAFGDLDHFGHAQQWRLAQHMQAQLDALEALIAALMDRGWKRIQVVTDHGWLLLPGGLPIRPSSSKELTESLWPRCAMMKTGTVPDGLPVVPWHWEPTLEVVSAHGCGVFRKGEEYAHGGLSLQECVVPVLTITAGASAVEGKFESVQWVRQRCRIKLSGSLAGATVDLRTKAGDPTSSVVGGGVLVNDQGQAALIVEDEDLRGTQAVLVLLNPGGTAVAKQATEIGGEV